MKKQDKEEFEQYLKQCTARQVQGVLEKEKAAGRKDYAELAEQELQRRGLEAS